MMLLYDCIDPKTGQTFREGNLATKHSVPLGTKVEVSDVVLTAFFSDEINIPGPIQLLVVGHTRDCDGTPLYILSDISVRYPSQEPPYSRATLLFHRTSTLVLHNYPEESLSVLGDPVKLTETIEDLLRVG